MTAPNCTTHHYACDCREAMFAEMVEALQESMLPYGPYDMAAYSAQGAHLNSILDWGVKTRAIIARATDQGEMK